MNTLKTTLPSLRQLRQDFSQFIFSEHQDFHWSAKENCIYYNKKLLTETVGLFQLFHEIGHALSGHTSFHSGVQLLKMEVEAWKRAQIIADTYGLVISEQQIEQCLDSYRDWLHRRSVCPQCQVIATEVSDCRYRCFNCQQQWKVPDNQQLRHYRLKLVSP